MEAIYYLLIFAVAVLIVANAFVSRYMANNDFKLIVIMLIILFTLICTGYFFSYNRIDPIEVYRGSTELVITEKTQNGEIIERDSVVILKQK